MKRFLFIALFSLALLMPAWEEPVRIDGGSLYFCEFTQVAFDYSGSAYVLYNFAPNFLRLAKYDGKKVKAMGQVNKSSKKTFAPCMFVAKDGKVHFVWAEATARSASEYYIMYRNLEGGTWSDITQIAKLNVVGIPQSKHAPPKIEFIHMAVDSNENVFIAYYDTTRAKCRFISKYGDVVKQEGWPVQLGLRMKFPDLAASDDYIHVVWQHGIAGTANYTNMWARRENKIDGKWLPIVDLKQKRNMSRSSHTPLVALDDKENPHFIYMDDGDGPGREILYRSWTGSAISEREFLSPNKGWYSNNQLAMFNKDNGFLGGHKVVKNVFYDWKVNGTWQGIKNIDSTKGSDNEWSDLSKDGKVAAVSYTLNFNSVYIVTSSEIVVNVPPIAVINADNESPFSSDTVNFNANGSTDPDGSIVSYHWNFGDGTTAEGNQVAHAFVSRYGDVKVRLTVTDDKGALSTASKIIHVKALYTATNITFEKKQVRTLLFDRNGYVIKWTPNEKNAAAGYNIVGYKIFRKTVGDSGDYAEIASVDVAKTSYIDVSIESTGGKEYLYSVCPFDEAGHFSPIANF